jgi:hypothetical protein
LPDRDTCPKFHDRAAEIAAQPFAAPPTADELPPFESLPKIQSSRRELESGRGGFNTELPHRRTVGALLCPSSRDGSPVAPTRLALSSNSGAGDDLDAMPRGKFGPDPARGAVGRLLGKAENFLARGENIAGGAEYGEHGELGAAPRCVGQHDQALFDIARRLADLRFHLQAGDAQFALRHRR